MTSDILRPLAPRPRGLNDFGLVYFGNDWYAENRTSSHHIAKRLALRVPLLYIDSPGLRPPSSSTRDVKRLLRKLGAALQPPRRVPEGLWHCTVPQIPYRHVPGVEPVNREFGLWAVRRAIRQVGFSRTVSWFVVPHPGFLAHRLGEALCVYYCIDDYAAHPGVDATRVSRLDRELTDAADLVFVAPPALLSAKQAQNATAVFSPHGVDVDLFSQAMSPDTALPPLARDLVRPVIGFFGSIAAWIDVELIAWLAAQRPTWTFLLVGQAFTDVTGLSSVPNVVLAGPQPYESLPAWAKAFDVAIIPYRMNQQVHNANPLKLREYLATGRPVVSVSNPEIERFARWVSIANDRDSFLAALEKALEPEPDSAAAARLAAVADMSWDSRVADVIARVEDALIAPAARPA